MFGDTLYLAVAYKTATGADGKPDNNGKNIVEIVSLRFDKE